MQFQFFFYNKTEMIFLNHLLAPSSVSCVTKKHAASQRSWPVICNICLTLCCVCACYQPATVHACYGGVGGSRKSHTTKICIVIICASPMNDLLKFNPVLVTQQCKSAPLSPHSHKTCQWSTQQIND